jgi:hypothetical protein
MMTPAQRRYYIDLARNAYAAEERPLPFDKWRHEQVAIALGAAKHFRDFNNKDFDRVRGHFEGIIDPARFSPENHTEEAGERRRLRILADEAFTALGSRYCHVILKERFHGTAFIEELETDELRQLVNTLQSRLASKRQPPSPCVTA